MARAELDTLAEVLSTPGFADVASLPLDPKTTRGQFSGDFTFRTKLPPVYDPSLASIEVNATVANFAADHLVGKAGLDQGALAVTLADGIVHVVGTGKIFGAPATLEFTPRPRPAGPGRHFLPDGRSGARQGRPEFRRRPSSGRSR